MRPPRTASARTELRTEPSEPDHTSARTGPNFRGTAAMRPPRTASARTELRTEPSEPDHTSARTGPNFRGTAAMRPPRTASARTELRTEPSERTNRPELPRTGRHATATHRLRTNGAADGTERAHEPARTSADRPPCDRHEMHAPTELHDPTGPHERSCGPRPERPEKTGDRRPASRRTRNVFANAYLCFTSTLWQRSHAPRR